MRQMKQKRRKAFSRRFLLFLFVFIILLAAVVIYVAITFRLTNRQNEDNGDIKYYYGSGDDAVYDRVSSETAKKDGVMYINFTKLADMLSMTVIGDGSTLRYVIGSSNEEVIFTDGDAAVVINGAGIRMSAPAEQDENSLWVPLEFVTSYMSGVSVVTNEEENSITIIKSDEPAFVIKPSDTIKPIPDGSEYGDTTEGSNDNTETDTVPVGTQIPPVEFTSDLTEYEKYMDPENRDDYLILVNSKNTIDETYIPTDLVDVKNTRDDGRNTQKLREYAARALEAMFIELYSCGYDQKGPGGYPVSVMSAYRSYSYQSQLFNMYTEREMNDDPSLTRAQAEKITETYSARPGTSEHQTGLCADLHNLSSASKAFANEDAYEWLVENCWKFGFVLRFPDGKTDITGITYEPWHYRYVGRYHAYMMNELDMCLEEYIEYLNN